MKKIISFEKKIDFPTMIGEITSISLDHNLKFTDESNVEGDFLLTGTYKLTEASRLEDDFNFKIQADILLNETLDLNTTKIDIEDFYYEIENDDTMICHIDVKIEGVEKIDEIEITEEPVILSTDSLESIKDNSTEVVEIKREERKASPLMESHMVESHKTELVENIKEENLQRAKTDSSQIQTEEVRTSKSSLEVCDAEDRECDGTYQSTEDIKNNMEMDNMNEQSEQRDQMPEVGSLFSSFKDTEETFSSYSVYIIREDETIQTLMEKYKTTKEELESYNDLSTITIGSKIIIPSKDE